MIVFRVYPELWLDKKYYFVKVRVYETRREMRAGMKADSYDTCKNTQGQCSGHAHYKNGRLTGWFATIWMNKKDLRLNAEIVPHECVHAAMRHIVNKKVDLSNMGGEEVLAYVVGSMTSQITTRLWKEKVFA